MMKISYLNDQSTINYYFDNHLVLILHYLNSRNWSIFSCFRPQSLGLNHSSAHIKVDMTNILCFQEEIISN